jgi:hypothetical protein
MARRLLLIRMVGWPRRRADRPGAYVRMDRHAVNDVMAGPLPRGWLL